MKIFYFLFCYFIVHQGCNSKQFNAINSINQHGSIQALEDSIMQNLRQRNDLVISLAKENFSWGKSVHYLIIALKDEEWAGYNYFVNKNSSSVPGGNENFNINPIVVNQQSCDSLLHFITEHEAWKISGDNGKAFCENKNDCVINDASVSRLWLITHDKVVSPAYYAPEFFEECCPGNKERKLFLDIANKIITITTIEAHSR